MFARLTLEVSDRASAMRRLLDSIREQEASEITRGVDPLCSKMFKGLVFVQLYATYEYTVSQTFSRSVGALNRFHLPLAELRDGLVALALDADFKAAGSAGIARTWTSRTSLLARARSRNPAVLSSDLFPSDGSHYRHRQLETIWAMFGITEPTVSAGRLIGRIDEIVEHRNAIAHGRETPESVGSRFTPNDLQVRIDDIEEICLHVVTTMSVHCSDHTRLT